MMFLGRSEMHRIQETGKSWSKKKKINKILYDKHNNEISSCWSGNKIYTTRRFHSKPLADMGNFFFFEKLFQVHSKALLYSTGNEKKMWLVYD